MSKNVTVSRSIPFIIVVFSAILLVVSHTLAEADEFVLKNGDKITGILVSKSSTQMVIDTELMGSISIPRSYVEQYKSDEEMAAEKAVDTGIEWTRKVSMSYAQEGGNDPESSGSARILISRKTDGDEATLKMSANIDTQNKKLDSRKFYGMARYANSFGEKNKWFQFGKVEGDQDNTTNVYYRITPSYGLGYWFADQKDFKFRVEGSLGYEYTKYNNGLGTEGNLVLTPNAHLEKSFDNGLAFVQDVTLYPSLEDFEKYRLHSESGLTGAITEDISWKISFIDDYDSQPKGDKKKNDWILNSGLEYSF